MKKAYLPRIADKLLKNALESAGAVLIEGPKWCGKTRTAEEIAASILYMQDPDKSESYLLAADTKPSLLLQGSTPRLLDEWQTAPVLWDAVRFAVDQRGENGQFIMTGSAVPVNNAVKHSGTGRISRILMRPMSLFESGESGGGVSLRSLFDGAGTIECFSTMSIEKLAFCLARGGWPASAGREENAILRRVYDYVDAIVNNDISRVDDVEKNPARVLALMRSLARNISTTAAITTIRDDIGADEKSLTEKSVSSYMNALRRLFVIEDLPAWGPALRSKTVIRTSPKRHFVDPSIAVAVLRASPDSLLKDFKTFGLLFESLCVRDLRIYAQILDGEVFHYYDKSGLEADAVICLKDGRWAAVEIKMGAKEIEKAAKNLLALKERIDAGKMHEPSFLLVVTAGEPAYRRDDGVFVVPIGCLRE
ncbi:MAG TPA: ATP-binding protein [bacterium]|nr:ATP-binding protein [bacterium]